MKVLLKSIFIFNILIIKYFAVFYGYCYKKNKKNFTLFFDLCNL